MSEFFNGEHPEKLSSNEKPDLLVEYILFAQDVVNLVAQLPEKRADGIAEFTFNIENHEHVENLMLPAAVADRSITALSVSLGEASAHEDPTLNIPATLSIDFFSEDDQFSLSSSGTSGAKEFSLYKINTPTDIPERGDAEIIDVVTKEEITTLLLSLALPKDQYADVDWTRLQNLDLQQGEMHEYLTSILISNTLGHTDNTLNYTSFQHYTTAHKGEVYFTKLNDQTSSFTLRYFDTTRQAPVMLRCDLPSTTSRNTQNTEDHRIGFGITFYVTANNEQREIKPTPEDLQFARALMSQEVAHDPNPTITLESLQHVGTHEQGLDEAEARVDEAAERDDWMLHEEIQMWLQSQVKKDLGEDGFNPPNPGA